jgi:nitrate reductase NapE component
MEEFRKNKHVADDEPLKTGPLSAETSYPAAIEKMSEKWRAIRQNQPEQEPHSFVQRNFLTVGIGVALLIIALLVVIGGFAFLVWKAQ